MSIRIGNKVYIDGIAEPFDFSPGGMNHRRLQGHGMPDDLLACRPGGIIHVRQIAPNPWDVPNRLFGTTLNQDGDAT